MVHTHFRFCYRPFPLSFPPLQPPLSPSIPGVPLGHLRCLLLSPCPQQAESSRKARKATSHLRGLTAWLGGGQLMFNE